MRVLSPAHFYQSLYFRVFLFVLNLDFSQVWPGSKMCDLINNLSFFQIFKSDLPGHDFPQDYSKGINVTFLRTDFILNEFRSHLSHSPNSLSLSRRILLMVNSVERFICDCIRILSRTAFRNAKVTYFDLVIPGNQDILRFQIPVQNNLFL